MDINLSQLFWQGLGYLLYALLIGAVVFGVVMVVRSLVKVARLKQPKALVYHILRVVCILIMVASWIFNIGWLRLALTFTGLPIIHAILFAYIAGKAISKFELSAKLEKYTVLSYITYVAAYLLFPDGGDYGEMYLLFTQINSNTVAYVAMMLALACFVANVVFLILSAVEAKKATNPN